MGGTATLAGFVAETSLEEIPEDAQVKAKEAIIDYVGVALYGSHHEVGETISDYVDSALPGSDAQVLARGTASTPGAALANGTFGHAIDYDDTFESIIIHPTSPVFAAAMAAGDHADASGADVLAGYVIGVEVAYRTGHSTYPSHYENGWHSTGTVGSFGAAAAAASILDLSTDEIRHAFGITASGSSSLKKNFGTMTKPLHAGHAAQVGVRAALLAQNGFTADTNVFEETLGYGNVMTIGDTFDPSALTEKLGEEWAVSDIGYKPYPSGVITHAAMDAMYEAVNEHDLTLDTVDSIVVTIDDAASEMLHHENPSNALEAKFSIEFCLSTILRERAAGIHEFTDEYVGTPETKAAMKKVSRAFESNLFGQDFGNYGARIRIETIDGEEIVVEERYAPGTPNNPVSAERLEAKFRECADTVLSADDVDGILSALNRLEADGMFERFKTHASA